MSPLLTHLFRPSTRREAAQQSPAQRILGFREQLLRCALLLLDDPRSTQEAVLRSLRQALRSPLLLELASTSEGDGPLGLALERLLIHQVLDLLRTTPRAERERDDAAAGKDDQARRQDPARRQDQGPVVAELQRLQRLGLALGTLSPETRVTLVLAVMQRRPLSQVAELLGCSLECCQFWLNHGRKLLRRVLQRDLLDGDAEPTSPRVITPPGALHDLYRSKKATARA